MFLKAFEDSGLLQVVFHQLESPSTLACCARVSRSWSRLALPVLWEGSYYGDKFESPYAKTLSCLASTPGRFEYYIDMVRHLSLKGPDLEKLLLQTEFPTSSQLKSVTLHGQNPKVEVRAIEQFFRPRLRYLWLQTGLVDLEFLQAVHELCHNLMGLRLPVSPHFDSELLGAFLAEMPTLKPLLLPPGLDVETGLMTQVVNSPLEVFLAYHYQGSYKTEYHFTHKSLRTNMRQLLLPHATLSGDAFKRLLEPLSYLQSLRLSGQRTSPIREFLLPLRHCPLLVDVVILLGANDKDYVVPGAALLRVAETCRHLRRFILGSSCGYKIVVAMHEEQLKSFTECLPRLEELRLPLNICYTAVRFDYFARRCSNLLVLDLGKAPIEVFGYNGRVFRHLEELCVGSLTSRKHIYHNSSSVQGGDLPSRGLLGALMNLLDRCMPRLRALRFDPPNPITNFESKPPDFNPYLTRLQSDINDRLQKKTRYLAPAPRIDMIRQLREEFLEKPRPIESRLSDIRHYDSRGPWTRPVNPLWPLTLTVRQDMDMLQKLDATV